MSKNSELIAEARDVVRWHSRYTTKQIARSVELLADALEEAEKENFALLDTMLEIERDTRHGKPMWDIHKMAAHAIAICKQEEAKNAE